MLFPSKPKLGRKTLPILVYLANFFISGCFTLMSSASLFQYYEMSYGLNVEMHKQVRHYDDFYTLTLSHNDVWFFCRLKLWRECPLSSAKCCLFCHKNTNNKWLLLSKEPNKSPCLTSTLPWLVWGWVKQLCLQKKILFLDPQYLATMFPPLPLSIFSAQFVAAFLLLLLLGDSKKVFWG